jgi:hypothetical protein
MSTAKTLRDAADYVSEHGWTQNEMQDDEGRVCAMGAIRETTAMYSLDGMNALQAMVKSLGLDRNRSGFLHPVAMWNDAKGRSAEDVILAFKRAAEYAEQEGM